MAALNEVTHQETDLIGSQYLGSELNRLRERKLRRRRRRDRDTLGLLFLGGVSLSLGRGLGLLACLPPPLLLLLLAWLGCCCSGLSVLIGLGSCMGSVSGVGCV